MNREKTESGGQEQALIKYWIEKAQECLESAKSEYENGRMSFAMNRIYYCAFYAVTALFRYRGKVVQET